MIELSLHKSPVPMSAVERQPPRIEVRESTSPPPACDLQVVVTGKWEPWELLAHLEAATAAILEHVDPHRARVGRQPSPPGATRS